MSEDNRSYCSFLDEISADELYEGLLAHGFFSEKLPPVFSSSSFYDYCNKNNYSSTSEWHDVIVFSSMRNTNVPRQLGIPTPMKYQRLCAVLRDNWDLLKAHFHNQTDKNQYRISRIHIRKQKDSKVLFEMNYKNWREDGNPETDLLFLPDAGVSKYVVKADISTCFQSIYTHSISWALVGKEESKKNIGTDSLWYNKIDKACQELKNGETHGLLIGPHASNILSEIILTAIDKKLHDKLKYDYFRNIDDYACYVGDYNSALKFLSDLEVSLRDYDLLLNHKKTEIVKLPKGIEESWIHKLNSIRLGSVESPANFKEVNTYLDTAIQLAEVNNDAAILKYAIKTLSKQSLSDNAKKHAGKRIMHLAVLYPYLIQLMGKYVFDAFGMESGEIKLFADSVYRDAKKVNNYEAISYAIYFSLKYGFCLEEVDIAWAIERRDCILLVMVWLYYLKCNHGNRGATELKPLVKEAKELHASEMDRYWLFCYEALSKGQLSGEWKSFKEASVSFVIPEHI